ncbi:glycine dehydrogenase, partial [Oleiphilus sp. HI0081]
MPFIPHTEHDIQKMLDVIGVDKVDDLFDEIPAHLRAKPLNGVPEGLGEMEMMRLMSERAQLDEGALCFIGAGAYEHHIPAAVWDVTMRGEFLTAYTPYQAEASQGTLQLIYEYQSMMCQLTAMDMSNASLYDGASGLAEAVLMAIRANRKSKSKKALIAGTVHPLYQQVVDDIVSNQGISIDVLPMDDKALAVDSAALESFAGQDYAALIIPQPNFFGSLEDVNALTNWGQANGMLVIGVVNPTALALLTPPGEWGDKGADIAVGEGQPLGIPMASGGPYFGFICCKEKLVRQMPGRIIGRTVDLEGKEGFTLTLQAREQHIRRSKATSNICTNQGLAVTAATIYMS